MLILSILLHSPPPCSFGTDGLVIQAEINDIVEIECPKTPNTTTGRQFAQYLTFSQVSREGFDACSTSRTHGTVRILLMCNRPFEDNSYLLLFLRDSPFPGGLTFTHSQTYYFITTSDGSLNGLHQTQGGLCSTHHMKVKFRIKPKPTEAIPTGQTVGTNPQPRPTVRPTRPTRRTTTQAQTTPVTQAVTRIPVKFTDKPLGETPKRNKPDTQSSDNGSHALRDTPLLILVSLCAAMLRWVLT